MRNLIRGLIAALLLAVLPLAANAGVFVSVTIAPPVLPVYSPPPVPGPGYLWTPGYWAWADGGYYWVPGTWVLAPSPGLLWTPGYWGFADGVYLWHAGYWGPHVGFYGGINYGFGYGGVGFHGGYWRGNTYFVDRVVINEAPVNRVCFNGGGGIVAHASPAELRFEHERHVGMSELQRHNEVLAARDNTMRASFNHGRPSVAATPRPGVFYGHGVVAARSGGERPAAAEHGMLGEHGAIGARPPVAMNSPGAPRGMNPSFRPETATARGAAANAVHAPTPGSVHQSFPGGAMRAPTPGGAAPQANPGMARQAYPGNARPAYGGAPPRANAMAAAPRGLAAAPRGEPGNAHAAQQGRGGERIVLAGFSQGGAMALFAGARHARPLAGVMALSCYMVLADTFAAERRAENAHTPIFLAHGLQDAVVAPALGAEARRQLEAAGCAVEWHTYSMPHSVCPQEIADIGAWLRRTLP